VATDVGGVRELVVHGETGHIVPPGDRGALTSALLELAADPKGARGMGEAGRRRQREHFTGAAMVDGYERAFEKAVTRGQA